MANNYFVHDTALVPGTKARAADVNNRFNAVEDGFDKLPAPTAGGFLDPVVVGEASSEDHAVTAGQVRDGELTYTVDTGTANTMVAALPQPPPAYTAGMTITVKVAETNTGATVLDLNGLGARPVKRISGEQLYAGDLVAGRVVGMRYDGTSFVMLDGTYAIHNHDDLYTRSNVVAAHTGNTSNPHGVTKVQVGLGNVANVDTTNASNITSGTLADARIPSTITRDSELNAHTSRTDNPHAVTKAQVGLANVANVDTTNASNITSGILADARIASTIARYSELNAHTSRTDNPHSVTPVQLGLGRKNLLINGGFDVWQRGTSFTTKGEYYAADRWYLRATRIGSVTLERKEFSIAEFENYFGKRYYTRISYSLGPSAEDVSYSVRIEDGVRLTAGKTVTLSFLCREAAGKPVYIQYHQYLGGTDYAGGIGTVQFSSSFERKSVTFEMPSVAGKTFGSGDSFLEISFIFTERFNGYVPRQAGTFDIGDVQLEFGDTATDFEYRHLAEELALCKYYFERVDNTSSVGSGYQYSNGVVANARGLSLSFTPKRIVPVITYTGYQVSGCTYANVLANTQSLEVRVNTTGAGSYRIWDGIFEIDAEIH